MADNNRRRSGDALGGDVLRRSEAAGVFGIAAFSLLLFFCCRHFGQSALTILFGSVNESAWEHVKAFGGGYAFFAALQLLWLRTPFRRYMTSKVIALYLGSALFLALHYLTRLLLGSTPTAADLAVLAVVIVFSQTVSCRMIGGAWENEVYFHAAAMFLLLYFLMFFSFTIFPPRLFLFYDSAAALYGFLQ